MPSKRLTPRGEDRRRQLMDYAARRFAGNGYHPTSVAEIVSGLGVGKGVFYWYFVSKEQLMLELLKESQQDLRRRQQREIGDEPDPVQRIALGMRASMAWFAENRHLFNLFEFARTEDRFAGVMRRGQDVAVGDLVRHVKDGIVEGRMRDADPLILTHAILGVTLQLAREFIHRQGEPGDEVADHAIAFCLAGLLA